MAQVFTRGSFGHCGCPCFGPGCCYPAFVFYFHPGIPQVSGSRRVQLGWNYDFTFNDDISPFPVSGERAYVVLPASSGNTNYGFDLIADTIALYGADSVKVIYLNDPIPEIGGYCCDPMDLDGDDDPDPADGAIVYVLNSDDGVWLPSDSYVYSVCNTSPGYTNQGALHLGATPIDGSIVQTPGWPCCGCLIQPGLIVEGVFPDQTYTLDQTPAGGTCVPSTGNFAVSHSCPSGFRFCNDGVEWHNIAGADSTPLTQPLSTSSDNGIGVTISSSSTLEKRAIGYSFSADICEHDLPVGDGKNVVMYAVGPNDVFPFPNLAGPGPTITLEFSPGVTSFGFQASGAAVGTRDTQLEIWNTWSGYTVITGQLTSSTYTPFSGSNGGFEGWVPLGYEISKVRVGITNKQDGICVGTLDLCRMVQS